MDATQEQVRTPVATPEEFAAFKAVLAALAALVGYAGDNPTANDHSEGWRAFVGSIERDVPDELHRLNAILMLAGTVETMIGDYACEQVKAQVGAVIAEILETERAGYDELDPAVRNGWKKRVAAIMQRYMGWIDVGMSDERNVMVREHLLTWVHELMARTFAQLAGIRADRAKAEGREPERVSADVS